MTDFEQMLQDMEGKLQTEAFPAPMRHCFSWACRDRAKAFIPAAIAEIKRLRERVENLETLLRLREGELDQQKIRNETDEAKRLMS